VNPSTNPFLCSNAPQVIGHSDVDHARSAGDDVDGVAGPSTSHCD
jgi:hypothetical protein